MTTAIVISLLAAAITPGWDNICTDRREFPVQKTLWTADLDAAKLELRDGAEGTMRVVDADGRKKLEIKKTNGKGKMVVTAPPFEVKPGAKLRVSAFCECDDGDPDEGEGYLRLYGRKEDLSYYKELDGRGAGGPRMQKMVNSAPGTRIRKLAHRLADAKTGTAITAAIVVEGPPSTSLWSEWLVEDKNASDKAWNSHRKSLAPKPITTGIQPDDEFARKIAADVDHNARIERRGAFSRLVVDGKVVPPVIYKGRVRGADASDGGMVYAGGIHDGVGLRLQCITVRLGCSPKEPLQPWTKDGFDPSIAVDTVRMAMRMAPNSLFILQLKLDAYPEWVERHPSEAWLLRDGRRVYGSHIHADYDVKPKVPDGKWLWPSYHSVKWREEVAAHCEEIIAELKRTGLAKRIVGLHLAGYHDAQMATRHPDFSPCAIKGFLEWQRERLGEVKWKDAPDFGDSRWLRPGSDDHKIAYLTFIKQGPFHVQEKIARRLRRAMGKDVVVGRYCMGWGAAAFNGALDLWPFMKSKDIDFLVAQPSYAMRIPGVAMGTRIPTDSFHEHGKLFVNEFDLRTYGGIAGNESELRVLGLSHATDFPMWQSIFRKCAGQMLARRMGWWYLDMSGTWFSPPEIAKDMGDVLGRVLETEADDAPGRGWRPSVAVAVDERGMLLRNSIAHYYDADSKELSAQVSRVSASGVPYDMWMAEDLAEHPELATGYKLVAFSDMREPDASRKALMRSLEKAGVATMSFDPSRGFSPKAFAEAVRRAGGYVPARYGLQVEMNGRFLSVHAVRGGHYDFTLPRECEAVNMKTGKVEAKGRVLPLDMLAGETCWFMLR
jgi:hypothetical protein